MPRKLLNDNYILSECPQYQPLGLPNALLPQVDKPPKLQGFKNVVPPRPTSISATISDLANNIYTPVPSNSKKKAENLIKAQKRVSQQIAVEVDPLAQDDVNELRAITLSLQSDVEEGVIRGDEELKEALKLSMQEPRAKVKIISTPAEERVRMALEDMPIPRSVKNPVFEKNIQEMERKIILQREQYLPEEEEEKFSIAQTYEEFLKQEEEREKREEEMKSDLISDEISAIMDMAKRGEITEERMNELIKDLEEVRKFGRPEEKPEEPEPPTEMAGDRLAPRAVIKTKEIEVRPARLQKLQRETFLQTRGVVEAEVKPELAIKLPKRVGLRGSMRGELR